MVGGQVLFLYILALLFLFGEQPLTSVVPKGLMDILEPKSNSKNSSANNTK